MTKFKYKAINKDGKEYEGSADAIDKFAVYSIVRKEGGTIVSVEEVGKGLFNISKIKNISFFGSVKASEKIMLAKNLSAMLSAGLSATRSIDVLKRQTKNKKLKKILVSVGNDVKSGNPLHTSIAKFPKTFSSMFVSMVKAGEESGGLSDALKVIANHLERSYTLTRKIKGAFIYPIIIVVVMIIIGIVMLTYVVPTLTKTFDEIGVDLPLSTQFVIALSDFLVNNTLIALIIFVIVAISATLWLRTKKGKRAFDFTILHIPIISGLVKETNSARTTHTLSALLSSGVDVVSSISITREVVQNSYYKDVLKIAGENVQKGKPISKVFQENDKIYPALVGEMMAVGEETGKLSEILLQIAEFYEGEVSQKTKDMSTIIEPFLMVFIGAVVGFFAVSMITPIYSISSGI